MNQLCTNVFRKDILGWSPYKSARSITLRNLHDSSIFLDANESHVSQNDLIENLNRYPDPQPKELLNELSKLYSTPIETILIGRGSDETIDILVRATCTPSDSIITFPPTFSLYTLAAKLQGTSTIEIPLVENGNSFNLDLNKFKLNINNKIPKLVFLCSPNNPTGTLIPREQILTICSLLSDKSLVVVDEAYIEYSSNQSMTNYLETFPNLVILRTLSKAWGLAGIRCGSLIAHSSIIDILQKIRPPYPIPTPTAVIATKTLKRKININDIVNESISRRNKLHAYLIEHPLVDKIFDSHANFLFVKLKNHSKFIISCKNNNIIIRDQSHQLKNCVRISIGSSSEIDALTTAIKDLT